MPWKTASKQSTSHERKQTRLISIKALSNPT
jgi:hypothetical protein